MEPARIDWNMVESIFVEDKLYENITAPKWVDLLAPDETSIDDESWFCRPDCNHPKTAEDFLRTTPPSNLSISGDRSKSPLGSWNLRDAKFKRRGQNHPSPKSSEDCENQNPNFLTPAIQHAKSMKETFKSSTESKKPADDALRKNEAPRLKSTLSARNLFAGRDILTHISEFCNELKKMALRTREREEDENLKENQTAERNDEVVDATKNPKEVLREVDAQEKERRPLLEMSAGKSDANVSGCVKEKPMRKRIVQDAENIPAPLNLANVKHKEEERLLQIRTNPPSPQCFSVARAPIKNIPPKDSKSRFMERGILQEVVKKNKEEVKQIKEVVKEETEEKGKSLSVAEGKEARGMDVFWFLKPCTLST